MNTRIYKVTAHGNDGSIDYLVEATSQTQARLHLAKVMITVSVAKPKDIAQLMAAGVKLETAGEGAQT